MSGGKKYTTQHEHAILALLEAPTIAEAATQCGIGEATLNRWLKRPDFQATYRAARRQMFEASLSRLQALAGQATGALEKALTCGKVSTEVRAAEAVLTHGKEAALLLDLMARIDQLETLMQQKATS